jgi:hypothetical protein
MAYSTFPKFKNSAPALQAAILRARKANKSAVPTVDNSSFATGSFLFHSNPASNNTITIGGTVVTFSTNVAIGASLAITLATLLAFLKASANVNLVKQTYAISGNSLVITGKTTGVLFTLASNFATVSPSQLVTITKRKAL